MDPVKFNRNRVPSFLGGSSGACSYYLSSSASGFLLEYKILVASALLSPFLKVLIIMLLLVGNPALLTVSWNSLTYSSAVLFPNRFFFLIFIEKCCLKSLEEDFFHRPLISSIVLSDSCFDIILSPVKGFSFIHIREYKDDLLFVGREIFVRTSFKEEVACMNKIINLSSISIKWFWFLKITFSFMINIHGCRSHSSWCHSNWF